MTDTRTLISTPDPPKFHLYDRVTVINASSHWYKDTGVITERRIDVADVVYRVRIDGKDSQYFLEVELQAAGSEPTGVTTFEGGGRREAAGNRPRFELLVPEGVPYDQQILTRFAQHMANGAEKYEARNWEKFSDQEALDRAKSSAFRHFMQWLSGDSPEEDHAVAVMFNIMAAEHVKGKLNG